jgi:hypothetical protein
MKALQLRRVAVNILNKQTDSRQGVILEFGIGRGANYYSP